MLVVALIEELVFRLIFGVMFAVHASVRIYYRRKATRTRRAESEAPPKTKPVRNWAYFAIAICILGMIIAYILYLFIPPWLPWFPLPFPSFVRWTGVILGFCVIPFLIWIHRTLGQYWSAQLEIQREHALITAGPYSRIRHPMYTAFILFTLGTVLLAANLLVTIFGLLMCVLFYPITKQEEQLLLTEFGDQYKAYMSRTGRFLPPMRGSKPRDIPDPKHPEKNSP